MGSTVSLIRPTVLQDGIPTVTLNLAQVKTILTHSHSDQWISALLITLALSLARAGRGECINFQCVCGDGFSGRTCDCTDDKSTCVYPLGDPSKLCSGEGRCICGQCVCNDYSLTLGQYCEDCLVRGRILKVLQI